MISSTPQGCCKGIDYSNASEVTLQDRVSAKTRLAYEQRSLLPRNTVHTVETLKWKCHIHEMDPSHKSHNASDKYPEMCTYVHVSVKKWCIVGYGTGALWDFW